LEVQVIDERIAPCTVDPALERAIAKLDRTLEIALCTPHRKTLALHCQCGRDCRLVAELLRQSERPSGERDRFDLVLGPDRCNTTMDQGLELLGAFQIVQELAELGGGTGKVLKLDQRPTSLEPDLPPLTFVLSKLEGLGVEVHSSTLRPAAPRLVGSDQEVMNGARRLVAFAPVIRQNRGERVGRSAVHLLDGSRDGRVPVTPCRARHDRVSDVANEHVLEGELRVTES
jgi:hypothetical protein